MHVDVALGLLEECAQVVAAAHRRVLSLIDPATEQPSAAPPTFADAAAAGTLPNLSVQQLRRASSASLESSIVRCITSDVMTDRISSGPTAAVDRRAAGGLRDGAFAAVSRLLGAERAERVSSVVATLQAVPAGRY
jgi:hypothetical protein